MLMPYQIVLILRWSARFWSKFRTKVDVRRGLHDFRRCSGWSNTWVLVPKWVSDDSKPLLSRAKPLKPELAHHWKKILSIFEFGPLWGVDEQQPVFGWIFGFRFVQYSISTGSGPIYSLIGRHIVVHLQSNLKLRRNVLSFGSLFIFEIYNL